jgi:alanine dehydrogenase
VIVGSVCELKEEEYRVGLTPEGARDLARLGHRVLIEAGAGVGSGFSDEAYVRAGATVVPDAASVWAEADLMVKVKEPQPEEFAQLKRDQTLFTYLHLAAVPEATRALLDAGTTAIAYETVQLDDGSLPLLTPMSQIAGRMAPQVGSRWLQHPGPGRGKLLSGLPGAPPARVVIFGAGTVAVNATDLAVAMGAQVTVVSLFLEDLRRLEDRWPNRLVTLPSTPVNIERAIEGADLLISGVLVRGGRGAPKLVSREDLKLVGAGAVIVDVAIDQGGSFETSRPTTHDDPIYVEEGVVHYCVANMPGSVPRTATSALTAATLSYVLRLAERGVHKALSSDLALARGLMTRNGRLVNQEVAKSLGI